MTCNLRCCVEEASRFDVFENGATENRMISDNSGATQVWDRLIPQTSGLMPQVAPMPHSDIPGIGKHVFGKLMQGKIH